MLELLDHIWVRLYYRLFVRPRSAAEAAPDWQIDLPAMKAAYRRTKDQNPLAGISMSFYLAGDGEGGKVLCGGLDQISADTQIAIDNMPAYQSKQFLRRLIEEGDRVFRAAWEQSIKE
jgi:hypothetical protein